MGARSDSGRVVVLGVGNVLMRDDALGPTVVQMLEARFEFPDDVELIDGGTPGLDFLPFIEGARAVIVADAVSSKGEPGDIRVYNKEQMLSTPLPPRVTPHQPGLREAMMATELTDCSPEELILVGVVPLDLELGTELTPQVQAAVEPVIEKIVQELIRLGRVPKRRTKELKPDLWWKKDSPP